MRAEANAGLVGIVSGGIDGTYLRIATDLASVLDGSEDGLRVFPVAGKGSIQNVNDVVFTRGIDIGIVQSDVLAYMKREPPFPDLDRFVQYITKLYDEEIHVLAATDIHSVEDLAFKKVNFDVRGSGTYMTANLVFGALKVPVEAMTDDQPLALEKLKRGEISALVYVVGKPAPLFQSLKPEDNLHFLPLPATGDLRETYMPASLGTQDYPGLVGRDEPVETLSVGSVMAVYNWAPGSERYRKVARFVDAFFKRLKDLQQPPRHPKWREIDLATAVAGWTRFAPAEQWISRAALDRSGPSRRADAQAETMPLDAHQHDALFKEFVAYEKRQAAAGSTTRLVLDPQERVALFKEFLAWRQRDGEPVRFAAAPDPRRPE